jgi:hypothetical protein
MIVISHDSFVWSNSLNENAFCRTIIKPSIKNERRRKKDGIKETFFFPFILISAVDVISFIPFIFQVPKKDSHDLRMKCKKKKNKNEMQTLVGTPLADCMDVENENFRSVAHPKCCIS